MVVSRFICNCNARAVYILIKFDFDPFHFITINKYDPSFESNRWKKEKGKKKKNCDSIDVTRGISKREDIQE